MDKHQKVICGSGFILTMLLLMATMMQVRHWGGETLEQQSQQYEELLKRANSNHNDILELRGLLEFDASRTVIYLKILVLNPQVDTELAKKIARSVARHSRAFSKDPDLILAIISIESNFDAKNFKSRADALGPMQVLKGKDKTICEGADIEDIDQNIRCGIKIYAHYELEYGRDMATVLTAYNRGPNPIDIAIRDGRDPSNGYAEKVTEVYDRLRTMPGAEIEP